MKKISVVGIIILVSISPLFRGLIHDFETYAFLMVAALLFALYIINKMMNAEAIHINKGFTILGLLLIAAYALSFINAVNPRQNFNALFQYIGFLLIFIVLYDYFQDRKQQLISMIMYTTVAAGLICAVVGLEALTGFKIWGATSAGNRLGSTFQYANTASIYFAICVLFVLALANNTKKIIPGAILAGIGNIFVFAFFLTGSRGGCIVGAAAFLLMLAIQPSSYKLKGVLCLVSMSLPVFILVKYFNSAADTQSSLVAAKWLIISFAFAFVLFFILMLPSKLFFKNKSISMPKGSGIVFAVSITFLIILAAIFRSEIILILPPILSNRLVNLSFNDINIMLRFEFDKDALKIIADNWLLGLGRGGWMALFQSVQGFFYAMTTVHNNYLEVFIEAGILGFLSNVLLSIAALYHTVVSYVKVKDTKLKIYLSGLFCGLLALLGHSVIDFDLTHISLQLLLWTMFAAVVPYASSASISTGKKSLFKQGCNISITGRPLKLFLVVLCSVMLSMNAVYFTAALNEHSALKYMNVKNYEYATAYYEEAYRLDPMNTTYSIELAKLYTYFAKISEKTEVKDSWLEKARSAAEKSVKGYKYFPYYIDTLVRTYLASDMPLQALDNAQRLIHYQKYRRGNYELLARCYLAAAEYYKKNDDIGKSKELLEKCLEIDNDPYLIKSNITVPYGTYPPEQQAQYSHSSELVAYLDEALVKLEKLKLTK